MKIEINDENIDVKEIMKQIKENVQSRGITESIVESNNKKVHQNLSDLEGYQFILNRIWNYPIEKPITSHRRISGPIIVWFKKAIRKLIRWYTIPSFEQQIEFNAHVVRAINTLVEDMKIDAQEKNKQSNTDQEAYNDQIKSYLLKVSELEQTVVSLNYKLTELICNCSEVKEEVESLKSENNDYANRYMDVKQKLDGIGNDLTSLNNHQVNMRVANERLRRIERKLKDRILDIEDNIQMMQPPSNELDFDYYLFEEYYRGTRESIKSKQKQYLDYFKPGQHVLDLGCGRGEFTELLIECGIKATAVDLNDDMVEYCRERGFPVIKGDIFSFLENVEDSSVDGVFLGQVIEHLEPSQFIQLTNIAYKKLKPNGWFIAETPNPQCMSVFTQSFYMDLTHVKPVHAYTAKFILESAGYNDVGTTYFSPNDDHLRLPSIEIEGVYSDSLKQFNETIVHWNNTIFGYQDYYVAGRK